MLPGIRFLFAAIVLTTSVLVFGLGAAALLRAAHEEVASVPTRRVMPPEPVFAQQVETPPPTLALLRVEPAAAEKIADAPAVAAIAPEPEPEAAPVPAVESEKLAALKVEDIAAETTTPEITARPEASATEAVAPTLAAAEPAASSETKTAALDVAPTPPAAAPATSEPDVTPALSNAETPTTKTAARGNPAAKVEKATAARKANEKTDRAEIRKQKRAERARERRRAAARRARLAAQQAASLQAADPFSQVTQQTQPATTTTTPALRTRQ